MPAGLRERPVAHEEPRALDYPPLHRRLEAPVGPPGVPHGGETPVDGVFEDPGHHQGDEVGGMLPVLVEDVDVHGPYVDVGVGQPGIRVIPAQSKTASCPAVGGLSPERTSEILPPSTTTEARSRGPSPVQSTSRAFVRSMVPATSLPLPVEPSSLQSTKLTSVTVPRNRDVRSAGLGCARSGPSAMGEWSETLPVLRRVQSAIREIPSSMTTGASRPASGPKGPPVQRSGPGLPCGEERRAERPEAAYGKTVDGALEEVPGDVQSYGDRQLARDHVPEAEHQAGEDYVERADERGVRVVGVQ